MLAQQIDIFQDFDSKINAYFTVGDFLKNDYKRIPTDEKVKTNLILLAEKIGDFKEKCRVDFAISSSYMPPEMSRKKGITNEFKTSNGWTTKHPVSRGEWASIIPIDPVDFQILVEEVRRFWDGGDYNIPQGKNWINLYLHKINYFFEYTK